ncbi:MAG: hypothetical protein Q9226_000368 [Calogaya cf. arnoldii]
MDPNPAAAAKAIPDEWDEDYEYQNSYLVSESSGKDRAHKVYVEETKSAPLFSVDVARRMRASSSESVFPQYGLLAANEQTHGLIAETDLHQDDSRVQPGAKSNDKRIFLNLNAPFSAFLCGSQGSGKSHTLSCMLEASLTESRLGKLPQPLTGLLFHWDRLVEPCEAAYLCSSGIEVTVLVSPGYYEKMKEKYENLPRLTPDSPKPKLVRKILQEVGRHRDSFPDQFYTEFKNALPKLNSDQSSGLDQRLGLLERFLDGLLDGIGFIHGADPMPRFGNTRAQLDDLERWKVEQRKKREGEPDIWSFKQGTLTIVDLSDPLSDEYAACTLFDICLGLFMENHTEGGTILALDEAHKYMSESDTSVAFTESLLSVIRLQRHYGTRVIISTQEPTISPKLLDLCSMSIVHRFTSPNWMLALRGHLAAVSDLGEGDPQRNLKEIFQTIVNLDVGQALLFSPSAILDAPHDSRSDASSRITKVQKLGLRYVKMRVRKSNFTAGGRSKLAVD